MKKRLNIFTIFLLSLLLAGCASSRNTVPQTQAAANEASADSSIADVENTSDEDDEESPPSESAETPTAPQAESTETGTATAPEKPETDVSAKDTEIKDEKGTPEEGKADASAPPESPAEETPALDENGTYTSKDDVACYIHLYGHLPSNFITKKEAEKLGWPGGSLEPYAPGMCIGGSRFGNYEGLLPEKEGRTYTECDIDTLGADKRGARRIVFSNDGLIYYTEDHYESFELLYGEDTDD